jgi:hypothetical protein
MIWRPDWLLNDDCKSIYAGSTSYYNDQKTLMVIKWPDHSTTWHKSVRLSNVSGFWTSDIYRRPPNTEPRAVFGLYLMPVPGIWKLDHFKSRQKNPVASLDRFGMKNIFLWLLLIKRSRLVRKCLVRLSNGKHKMAAILFLPFESQTEVFYF